jgi:hypothetical protein
LAIVLSGANLGANAVKRNAKMGSGPLSPLIDVHRREPTGFGPRMGNR